MSNHCDLQNADIPPFSLPGYAIAIPVIYISGAINTTTAARFVHLRIFGNTRHRYISTKTGIIAWVGICLGLTVLAWIIAEAVSGGLLKR